VLAVFAGAHGYISPRWYATPVAVPTWNYVAVHVHGRARTEHDPAVLRAHLERLIAVNESGRPQPWSMAEAPADFIEKMLGGLVGIDIAIERIEGKRKMSQNRSTADQAGVIAALRSGGTESGLELAAEMAPTDFSWYRSDD
jgi:transcriptional regulator